MTKKSVNQGGRPTKKEDAVVQKLEHWFHLDMCVETCCEYAGISKQTYYNWITNDEGFSTKMKRAQINLKYLAHIKLKELIESWDKQVILRWLNRRDKRYWDKIKIEEEKKHVTITLEHAEKLAKLAREAKERIKTRKEQEE